MVSWSFEMELGNKTQKKYSLKSPSNTCINCSQSCHDQEIIYELKIPSDFLCEEAPSRNRNGNVNEIKDELITVSIEMILESIYNLRYTLVGKLTQNGAVGVCPNCGQVLQNLYSSLVKFNYLRKSMDSLLTSKIIEMDKILKQLESTFNEMLKSTFEADQEKKMKLSKMEDQNMTYHPPSQVKSSPIIFLGRMPVVKLTRLRPDQLPSSKRNFEEDLMIDECSDITSDSQSSQSDDEDNEVEPVYLGKVDEVQEKAAGVDLQYHNCTICHMPFLSRSELESHLYNAHAERNEMSLSKLEIIERIVKTLQLKNQKPHRAQTDSAVVPQIEPPSDQPDEPVPVPKVLIQTVNSENVANQTLIEDSTLNISDPLLARIETEIIPPVSPLMLIEDNRENTEYIGDLFDLLVVPLNSFESDECNMIPVDPTVPVRTLIVSRRTRKKFHLPKSTAAQTFQGSTQDEDSVEYIRAEEALSIPTFIEKAERFYCRVCKQRWEGQSKGQEFFDHFISTHSNQNCPHCPHLLFLTKMSMKNHVKTFHPTMTIYECSHCPHLFLTNESMKNHIKTFHPTLTVYECSRCAWFTTVQSQMIAHSTKGQIKQPLIPRKKCKRKSRSRSPEEYNIPVPLVPKDIRISCPEPNCNEWFSHESTFKRHLRFHFKNSTGSPQSFTTTPRQLDQKPSETTTSLQLGQEPSKATTSRQLGQKPSKIFQCFFCTRQFLRKDLRDHHQASHDSCFTFFPCTRPNCLRKFIHEDALARHMKQCKGKKLLTYPKCQSTFNAHADLNYDLIKRENIKPYKCSHCDLSLSCKESLVRHMRVKHSKKKFQCNVENCGKLFASQVHLNFHTAVHGEKSHLCSVCGYSSYRVSALTVHMKAHFGIKAFSCPQCPMKFRRSISLKDHLSIHTMERTYICSLCDKTFRLFKNLMQHMKSHTKTKEKPYKCQECGVEYSKEEMWKKHMSTHQRQKVDDTKSIGIERDEETSNDSAEYVEIKMKDEFD